MPSKFTAPKGTLDVLAPQSRRYAALVERYAERVTAAGYDLVVLPMFEDVDVFRRVGESTDIVRKEMYEFDDKGGRRIALKPDGTAPVVRAFLQHPADALEGLVRRAQVPLRAPAEGPLS